MAFPLKDVRLTTRRPSGAQAATAPGSGEVLPMAYPRLLRDDSLLPKIRYAIGYFDSMVGHERRELDPELLVQFFGDHKLARCVVSCLARSYRYRSPLIEEVVTRGALKRLQRAGIDHPRLLRLALYDVANRAAAPEPARPSRSRSALAAVTSAGDGFVRTVDRPDVFGRMEVSLGLRTGEMERLLHLDAEEHAVLHRFGQAPRAEDVAAQYNFGVLDTLLRHAEQVDIALPALNGDEQASVRRLCAGNEVDAELKSGSRASLLRLRGRQDAMGLWSRHGRRVARTVVQVLERSGPGAVLDAAACIVVRDRRLCLRLTPEVLPFLASRAAPAAGWESAPEEATRQAVELFVARQLALAPPGSTRVRRLPEPQAWQAGVLVPDALLESAHERRHVVAVRSLGHAARLAAVVRGVPEAASIAFCGPQEYLAPLQGADATLPVAS